MELVDLSKTVVLRSFGDVRYEAVRVDKLNHESKAELVNEMCRATGKDCVGNQSEIFRMFLDEGHECVLARDGGRLVGYSWGFKDTYTVTYDDYNIKNIHLNLSNDTIFFGNGYIVPEYRLKGLFPKLTYSCMKQFPRAKRFFTTIDIGNKLSFNSHRRFGYTPSFLLTCISIGNIQLHLFRDANKSTFYKVGFRKGQKLQMTFK